MGLTTVGEERTFFSTPVYLGFTNVNFWMSQSATQIQKNLSYEYKAISMDKCFLTIDILLHEWTEFYQIFVVDFSYRGIEESHRAVQYWTAYPNK